MENVERIKALRNCGSTMGDCGLCFYKNHPMCHMKLMTDAADALEAAEKRIANQQKQITKLSNLLDNKIEELEAQFLKEGEWKWNPSLNEYEWVDHTIYCPKCGVRMRRDGK